MASTKPITAPEVALRAFRFALDPTPAQRQQLAQHAGTARWAFNHALGRKVAAHREWRAAVTDLVSMGVDETGARKQVKVPIPSARTIRWDLNRVKGDEATGTAGVCPWWRQVSTYAFQSAFRDADAAWSNWLASLKGTRAGRPIGYPRFKKKGRSRDSVRIHHDVTKPTIRLDGYRHLIVPKIGSLRLHQTGKRMSRYLARTGGQVQSVTLSRSGDRWYAAVLVKAPASPQTAPTRAQRTAGIVGVDLGVSRLATLSTGIDQSYANPRHLAVARKRLTKAQRALARAENGSNRRSALVRRIGRLHHSVAEQRAGGLHQITKQLATRFAGVAVEDLNVAGMTRSSRGTVDKPGKKVRQKAGLNRSILDGGFGEFRRQLTYKTGCYGSTLHVVDRFFPSSKTCSACGSVKSKLGLQDRVYRCDNCGLSLDRDLNAAINIAAAASPAVPVAVDTPETQNARRACGRPAPRGRQRALKREDPPGSPHRSDSVALPAAG